MSAKWQMPLITSRGLAILESTLLRVQAYSGLDTTKKLNFLCLEAAQR
ncbi:hypothetical protein KSX25_06830 [Acinetobacter baumannii]|nr:hypothetical protein [Acinetobacter baumannii]